MGDSAALLGVDDCVRRLVTIARVCLQADLALLATAGTEQRLLVTDGDAGAFGLAPGSEIPMRASLCDAMLDGRIPRVLVDTHLHPVARATPVVAAHGVRSYAAAPVLDEVGHPIATLCAVGRTVDDRRHTTDARFLSALARDIGPLLTAPPPDVLAPDLEPDGLAALDADARRRVRLSLEVGSRLGVDAEGLVGLADIASAHEPRPEPDPETGPLAERIVAAVRAYLGLTVGAGPTVGAGAARAIVLREAGTRLCALSVTALLAVLSGEIAPDGGWLSR